MGQSLERVRLESAGIPTTVYQIKADGVCFLNIRKLYGQIVILSFCFGFFIKKLVKLIVYFHSFNVISEDASIKTNYR